MTSTTVLRMPSYLQVIWAMAPSAKVVTYVVSLQQQECGLAFTLFLQGPLCFYKTFDLEGCHPFVKHCPSDQATHLLFSLRFLVNRGSGQGGQIRNIVKPQINLLER
eukprot:PhF_6_TR37511/c0_g1_i16/m.55429